MNKIKRTLLIVDDSPLYLASSKSILESRYDVVTCNSATEMFEILETMTPDIIILDIVMPGIDGLSAAKQLKADDRYNMIPIIFLSGMSDDESEEKGYSFAVDYIKKPFNEARLINRVGNQVELIELRSYMKEIKDKKREE